MKRRRINSEQGVTITEILASMVLFSLVGAAINAVIIGTFNSIGYQARMVDAQLDVVSALTLLQDDLLAAGYIPDSMDQPVFQELVTGTQTDSIRFAGDVNSDNLSERITYVVADGKLMRTQETWDGAGGWTAAVPQPLAAGVTAFTLKFYLVDPCTAVVSEQTAAQVLATGTTTYISTSLTGSGSYKQKVIVTRTLKSDVAVRQGNVLPTCS